MPAAFQLTARTGHPSFLDLPWDTPLEEWTSERIVTVIRGISRNVVRFVEYDNVLYARSPRSGATRCSSRRSRRCRRTCGLRCRQRRFLSERAGKDVRIDEAVRSYVNSELPKRRPERVVLEEPL